MFGKKLRILHYRPGNEDVKILLEDLTGITSNPKAISEYYGEMSRLCKENAGIGLAANQVGLRENFFFVAGKARLLPSPSGVLVINPSWEPHRDAKQYVAKGEGCLSLPNPNGVGTRKFDVPRWTKIVASWTDSAGNHVKPRTLSGLVAQVFQHEHDHLRGVILTMSGTEIKIL